MSAVADKFAAIRTRPIRRWADASPVTRHSSRGVCMDRLATRRDALNRQESYQYDPAGNLNQFTDRKNQTTTFTYDNLNRRIGASYADSTSTSFTYDAVGRLIKATDSIVGTIEFVYDNLDRLSKEISAQGVVEYTYDALGRRSTMKANGATPVSYGYDAASRLTQVAQAGLVVGLGYDNANRRTSLTYPNGTNASYTYDNASRLTSIVHNGLAGLIESLSYVYDAAGNRVSLTRTNGTASNLPQAVQAAYDAANEQIAFNSLPATFDANGNLATSTDAGGTTTYTWDTRNRMVAQTGPGVNASFQYDALGRRVRKTINSVTTSYLYDGNDIVQEIGGSAVGASYVRSLSIDEPFMRQTSTGNEFYHVDALGSTLDLTSQAGAMQASYGYEAFGKTTITGTSSNSFQYTGRENDGTGLYYHRYRYYSPIQQRFLGEDPLGLLAGPNFYRYVLNNPIRFIDPLGLDVTVILYVGQNGNVFNHIGVGVNSTTTFGFTTDDPLAKWGYTVPGYVEPDLTPVLQTIPIPTSPQQDDMMNAVIRNNLGVTRPYHVTTNNCVTFVLNVLRAGGVQVPNTIFPNTLMNYLGQAYGNPPRP